MGERCRQGAAAGRADVDAATAIGGSPCTGSYDTNGDLLCRAPSSATTCAGTQTGNILTYDNLGQLATWQNTPTNPTTKPASSMTAQAIASSRW